jgi:hypothetical protein
VPVSRQPMVGRDQAHFLIDRMEERREIRMHCTISGMFVHWQLAEAQRGTFLNAEFGTDPLRRRDRLIDFTVGRRFFALARRGCGEPQVAVYAAREGARRTATSTDPR